MAPTLSFLGSSFPSRLTTRCPSKQCMNWCAMTQFPQSKLAQSRQRPTACESLLLQPVQERLCGGGGGGCGGGSDSRRPRSERSSVMPRGKRCGSQQQSLFSQPLGSGHRGLLWPDALHSLTVRLDEVLLPSSVLLNALDFFSGFRWVLCSNAVESGAVVGEAIFKPTACLKQTPQPKSDQP
jgi:hypothetical protein